MKIYNFFNLNQTPAGPGLIAPEDNYVKVLSLHLGEDCYDFIGLTLLACEIYEPISDDPLLHISISDEDNSYMDLYYRVTSCGGYSGWIESIEGIEGILGSKIINIKQHELDTANHREGILYNIDICTEKGCGTIDFRSDCNGYYGASLNLKELKIRLNNY